MARRVVVAAAALMVALLLVVVLVGRGSVSSARITEDDRRWDCRTMGNRICGHG